MVKEKLYPSSLVNQPSFVGKEMIPGEVPTGAKSEKGRVDNT